MEINNNPLLLWLLVGAMLLIAWMVMPLGSFYRYVQKQHCLQTFGRPGQTSLVTIETLERAEQFRSGYRYHFVLTAEDNSFIFAYRGADDLINPSNYDVPALYEQLRQFEGQQPFEVRWVRSWIFAGDEQLMTHLESEPIEASCAWEWLPLYGLLFAFFGVLTAMVVSVVTVAQRMVEQEGKVSQDDIIKAAVDRWVKWFEERFGKR